MYYFVAARKFLQFDVGITTEWGLKVLLRFFHFLQLRNQKYKVISRCSHNNILI
jgi:hypothetical protein